jgi:hypothetical protein
VIGLCLAVGAVVHATLPATEFTLAWTHSVEKVRWEEDYRVDGRLLVAVAARVRGSGAGMEPPADAMWRDGAWHYHPAIGPLPMLRVTLSSYAGDYELCWNDHCAPLSDVVAVRGGIDVVEISACEP